MKDKLSKNQALARIKSLLSQAFGSKSGKLVKEAHNLRLKTNTRLPTELKLKYCKYCQILRTSENSRTRKTAKSINIFCKKCKNITRIGTK